MNRALVCSHLSKKYPIKTPTAMAPTNVKGNSRANATLLEVAFASLLGRGASPASSGLLSDGILRHAQERLRIQPRCYRNKDGDGERD